MCVSGLPGAVLDSALGENETRNLSNTSPMLLSHNLGRTGPPGCLTLARWADRSGVQVGRRVKC